MKAAILHDTTAVCAYSLIRAYILYNGDNMVFSLAKPYRTISEYIGRNTDGEKCLSPLN